MKGLKELNVAGQQQSLYDMAGTRICVKKMVSAILVFIQTRKEHLL